MHVSTRQISKEEAMGQQQLSRKFLIAMRLRAVYLFHPCTVTHLSQHLFQSSFRHTSHPQSRSSLPHSTMVLDQNFRRGQDRSTRLAHLFIRQFLILINRDTLCDTREGNRYISCIPPRRKNRMPIEVSSRQPTLAGTAP